MLPAIRQVVLVLLGAAALAVPIGCVHRRDAREDTGATHAGVRPPRAAPWPQVTPLGESIEGRPIVLHLFGDAPHPVLVIGGIHGNEPTAALVAQRLCDDLRNDSGLWNGPAGGSVAVLPVANPDGRESGLRSNARGVDINRNFPASNWRRRAHRHNNYGTEPLSEPESRAIATAIETLHPRLIVSIHSIDGGRQCNNFDGPAAAAAEVLSRHNGYPVQSSIGYPTPGSLGSWAGIDRQIPVVTLELPRHLSGEEAWAENAAALFAAITFQGGAPRAPRSGETDGKGGE